jgi:hypothetical protein
MSAMRPQSRRKQPKASEYDETIHCSLLSGMDRTSPMVGRMMTTLWRERVCSRVC